MSRRQLAAAPANPQAFEPKAYVCNGVQERDVLIYKEIFNLLDPSAMQEVTPNDLRMALQSVNIRLNKADLYNLICDYDKSEKGKIDFDEFMGAMNGTTKPFTEDSNADYLRVFKKMAGNKEHITKDDLLNHSRSTGKVFTEAELEKIFEKLECPDEKIGFEKYHKCMDLFMNKAMSSPENSLPLDCGKSVTKQSVSTKKAAVSFFDQDSRSSSSESNQN